MMGPEPVPLKSSRRLLARPITLLQQGQTNDCGPCATTVALRSLGATDLTTTAVDRAMWPFRIPFVGATTPRAVRFAMRRLGARGRGGWFGTLGDLRRAVDANLPTLVIVRPTDYGAIRPFDLHFRVVVGYEDDPQAPGGSWLYFACSGRGSACVAENDAGARANVRVSAAEFERQWRTWATWHWFLTITGIAPPAGSSDSPHPES